MVSGEFGARDRDFDLICSTLILCMIVFWFAIIFHVWGLLALLLIILLPIILWFMYRLSKTYADTSEET